MLCSDQAYAFYKFYFFLNDSIPFFTIGAPPVHRDVRDVI